jgi:hypothetical protein
MPLWVLFIILLGVAAMSIQNYYVSQRHISRMEAFMVQGPRFTAEDGKALSARVTALEIKLQETANK